MLPAGSVFIFLQGRGCRDAKDTTDTPTSATFQPSMARHWGMCKRSWVEPHIVLAPMMMENTPMGQKMFFQFAPTQHTCPSAGPAG